MSDAADDHNRDISRVFYTVSDKKNGAGSLSEVIKAELTGNENILGIKLEIIRQNTPSKRKKISLSIKLDREDVFEYVKTIDFYLKNKKMLSRYKTSIEQLSPREKEICLLLSKGHSSAEIGERLFISTDTVRTHRKNIFRKLECNSVKELIFYSMLL
ncbi:helix-turn-helix transcriptional regulator [Niabella drilacis]|uniref:Regulatory protein, luxR family n=1 Tax=Niabella drilacis (strain DSM 25811 / CCM 8410 / CCUG 62505 / LMG 26954 / E90) TaxID=1285928 RepID=A0A1G6SL85_NIADE|nr:helix-turn-helix transcriptional regulator [Niabella drilacis]SDD16967.1 regulatory protein, luxR family [Niabella drilacis]